MTEPLKPDDSMDEVLQSLIGGFRDEARELLGDMESALMELEERPDDGELVARAFRALHTIKGNGAMFGLEELERFAHDLEHVFDLLRKGKMSVTSEIIDLTLGAKDGSSPCSKAARTPPRSAVCARPTGSGSRGCSPDPANRPPQAQAPREPELPAAGGTPETRRTWRILFTPERKLFAGGTDPLFVFEELRALGECSVTARFDAVPALEEIDPGICYLSWEILLTTSRALPEIRDAFIFVGGDAAIEITPLVPADAPDAARPAAESRGRPGGGDRRGAGRPDPRRRRSARRESGAGRRAARLRRGGGAPEIGRGGLHPAGRCGEARQTGGPGR